MGGQWMRNYIEREEKVFEMVIVGMEYKEHVHVFSSI
jgi:hypothetical protein